jgi:hypothetical protein
MDTEGWLWRRRDFWGVGPDSEKKSSSSTSSAIAALVNGPTGDNGESSRGGVVDNDDGDDDDDDEKDATFRFSSVSGQRQAMGLETKPFHHSKSKAGRMKQSNSLDDKSDDKLLSTAERLRKMYGVRCGDGTDNDRQGDDDEEGDEGEGDDWEEAAKKAALEVVRDRRGVEETLRDFELLAEKCLKQFPIN